MPGLITAGDGKLPLLFFFRWQKKAYRTRETPKKTFPASFRESSVCLAEKAFATERVTKTENRKVSPPQKKGSKKKEDGWTQQPREKEKRVEERHEKCLFSSAIDEKKTAHALLALFQERGRKGGRGPLNDLSSFSLHSTILTFLLLSGPSSPHAGKALLLLLPSRRLLRAR